MEAISVTCVISAPVMALKRCKRCCSSGRSTRLMRAERSAARMDRACPSNVVENESAKPRTPVSAPTPIATDSTTKMNLTRANISSRAAMRSAVRQGSAGFLASIVGGISGSLRRQRQARVPRH